jgi:hypothetical protein
MMKKFLAIAALAAGFLGLGDVNAAVISGVGTATPEKAAEAVKKFVEANSSPATIKNMSSYEIECKTSAGTFKLTPGVATEIRITKDTRGEFIKLLSTSGSIQTVIRIQPGFRYELTAPSYPDLKDNTLTVYN